MYRVDGVPSLDLEHRGPESLSTLVDKLVDLAIQVVVHHDNHTGNTVLTRMYALYGSSRSVRDLKSEV